MLRDDARVHRTPASAWREIDGRVAIVSVDVGRVRVLNAVGGFVWQKCEGRTVAELTDAVVEHFEVEAALARADVEHFVADLADRGMVRLETGL